MKKLLGIVVSLILLLSSCRSDYVYSKSYEFDDYTWHVDSLLDFKFDIQDTSKLYTFFIDVRHTSAFEFSNFYVFPKRTSPNGKTYTDTLRIPLADDKTGQWFGKGIGDILDNKVLWLKNVKFQELGNYKFTFEQGSRDPILEELINFGFSIYTPEDKSSQ